MMRLLNICVIGALVLAAAYVYKIKFESTRQAERVAKLRMEIRREHDAIAALRAEWSKLDNPLRIEELAQQGRSISLWDLEKRRLLLVLPERQSLPWSFAWSPDKQRLAVGLSDGGLVVWDLTAVRAHLAEIGMDW